MDTQPQTSTRSTSETGHSKNAANFNLLLTAVQQMGSGYQPSNPLITITALSAKALSVLDAISLCTTAQREAAEAKNRRAELFAQLNPFATRVFNTLQASQNVQALTLDDARGILNKMYGRRASGQTKAALVKAAAEKGAVTAGPRSVSQLSFDQRISHFTELRTLIKSQPGYQPLEQEITYASILAFEDAIVEANQAVVLSAGKLIDARNLRDAELYDKTTGALAIVALVKSYIKGKLTMKHPDFLKISGISFVRFRGNKGKLK